MIDLLVLMHAAREATHFMHWFAAGAQHVELADIYDKFDGYFDAIAEKMIQAGDEKELDLKKIISSSLSQVGSVPGQEVKNQTEFFAHLVKVVDTILDKIEELNKLPLSAGEVDMLGGFANEIEVIKYKSIKLSKF